MNTAILFKNYFQHAALVSVVTLAAFRLFNSFAAETASAATTATIFKPTEIAKTMPWFSGNALLSMINFCFIFYPVNFYRLSVFNKWHISCDFIYTEIT
jgi:hypothetical protein